ncbi:hypothetical protein VP1G_09308 [Cytospora mali]|uniref:Uncharacterized protein n=1 Tax=Cytospora mali TaxID=578113 RepID=A0A194VDV8_CYTMA|nr:hypothetical protein VP1G_09308 [Valsa mali var. pyri (nom. inval.)]
MVIAVVKIARRGVVEEYLRPEGTFFDISVAVANERACDIGSTSNALARGVAATVDQNEAEGGGLEVQVV